MLIEVVALEPPHHDEGVVTIHLEKLLTGEASEVNSLDAVFGGGLSQEKKTCYCVECDNFFHGTIPCFAHAVLRRAWGDSLPDPNSAPTGPFGWFPARVAWRAARPRLGGRVE